jgi:hypothetical protein
VPLVFSYGTLQDEHVQQSTFGRLLQGQRDELLGCEPDAELAAADQYEQLAAYKRVAAMLASGKQAWVYVDARSAPRAS